MTDKQEGLDPSIFKMMIETSDEPMGITDLSSCLVYVNEAANRFFRQEDITGKNLTDILPNDYKIELLDKVLSSKKPETKTVYGHDDKGHRTLLFEATAYPYPTDDPRYIIYRINKIEHHLKQELETTQNLYTKLVENMPDAVLVHQKGVITHANPAACRLLKAANVDELIGTPAINLVHPDQQKEVAERIQLGIGTPGHVAPPIEEKLVALDGTLFYAEVSNASVELDNEISVLVMVRDITKEKAYKEEIVSTNTKLEELNRSLEEKVEYELMRHREQEQLMLQQSKLAAMGEMIGAIAHQWRQPLNALGLNIQDMVDARDHGELDDRYLDNLVSRSMQQIQYMSTTIDDFRNFFKSNKERLPFNFVQAVHDVLSILSAQLKHHEIGTSIKVVDGVENLEIQGYENELKQVLINLINNAKDAIDETGRGHGRIDITIGREDGMIYAEIRDDGSGVPESIKEKIFNPYFTTKEQGRGTGIGLYMSKTIIEQNMEGGLQLLKKSDPTTFKILLPVIEL